MVRDHSQLRKLAIVPAYNEQGMVGRVVRDIQRQAAGFDVVVVDDGSTDNTAAEAEAEGAVVLRHPFNTGIGGAMQSGFKYALRNSYDVGARARMNARGFGRSSIDYPRSAYYMAKVLLALFVGLFRRRPTPVEATGKHELVEPPAPDAAATQEPAR